MEMIFFAVFLFLLVPLAAARAEGLGKAEVLRPYLDSQTLFVAHLDASKIDVAAMEKFAKEILDSAKVPDADDVTKQIHAMSGVAAAQIAQFGKLGGRHVYTVVSHTDLFPNMPNMQGAILIPLEAGGDAKAMAELLRPMMPVPGVPIELLGKDLLFVGDPATLKRLQ